MELAHAITGPPTGPVIVLLHGVTNSRERHRGILVPWLVDRGYRVVNVDLRGHGKSARADSYGLDDYASDVVELIAQVDSNQAIVVGHSMGGIVASAVAAARPDLVRALFLEDPALYRPGPGDPEQVLAAALSFVDELREGQHTGVTAQDLVTEIVDAPSAYQGRTMGDVATHDALHAIALAWLAVDPDAIETFFEWTTFDEDNRWSQIQCPVTIVRSDPALDAHFLPEDIDRFTTSVPHALIRSAEGVGHSILLDPEGPDRYLVELDGFLATIP